MRILIYAPVDGVSTILVMASPGKGRGPKILQGITQENVVEKVLPAVEDARRPREQRPLPRH